jgi:hypothetical protein
MIAGNAFIHSAWKKIRLLKTRNGRPRIIGEIRNDLFKMILRKSLVGEKCAPIALSLKRISCPPTCFAAVGVVKSTIAVVTVKSYTGKRRTRRSVERRSNQSVLLDYRKASLSKAGTNKPISKAVAHPSATLANSSGITIRCVTCGIRAIRHLVVMRAIGLGVLLVAVETVLAPKLNCCK